MGAGRGLFLAGVCLALLGSALPATAELIFASEFQSLPSGVILNGNAVLTGGYIRLTDNAVNQTGTMLLPRPNKPLPSISINFAGYIGSPNFTGGTGMCVAYGPIDDSALFGNDIPLSSGLKIRFYTGANRFQIYYNGQLCANVPATYLRYNGLRQFHITVTADGRCSVYQNGYIRASNVVLPGWDPQANWRVAFGGSTSISAKDIHGVDSLQVTTSEPRILSMMTRDPSPVGGTTTEIGYNVTFSEPMQNLDPADFVITALAGSPLAEIKEITAPTYWVQENFNGSAGVGTLTGSANVTSTTLRLTNGGAAESGGWYFQPPSALRSFYCSFRLYCGANGARTASGEGAWFGYAPNANDYQTINPNTTSGLYVVFDTYQNTFAEIAPSVSVRYNGVTRAFSRENVAGNWINVAIGVDEDGLCTVTVNNRSICGDLRLSGWAPQNGWYFGLAGFASNANPYPHFVDDFNLRNSTRQVILHNLGGEGTIRLDLDNATANDMFGAQLITNTYTLGQMYELDFVPPVITLNGDNPMTLECGVEHYSEPGATALDNREGDLSAAIVIDTSGLDEQVGTYTVSYRVSDSLGNQAEVLRTVIVQDSIPPQVWLLGGDTILTECHYSFNDPGAFAFDTCSGNLPVTVTGTVDTDTVGTYTLTYVATDGVGLSHQITRTVQVVDTIPPAIGEPNSVTADCGIPLTLPDRNGYDLCAGILPTSVVDLGSLDLMNPVVGDYQVAYEANDGLNVTISYLSVSIVDNEPPVITVENTAPIIGECGMPLPLPNAYWTDNCAGSGIPGVSPSDVFPVGSYRIWFTASDGQNPMVFAPIDGIQATVYDTLPPNIVLNGSSEITLNCGEVYEEPGATAIDLCEGVLTTMEIQSAVPAGYLPPGTWTVTYTARDRFDNTETVTRTVTVQDNCTLQVIPVTPNPATAVVDQPFRIEVRVEGAVGPVNLQWYRKTGSKVWEPLPGETDAVLTFDPVGFEDAGWYYCEATDQVTTVQSPEIQLIVEWGIPVAGMAGLTLLAVGLAALGAQKNRNR